MYLIKQKAKYKNNFSDLKIELNSIEWRHGSTWRKTILQKQINAYATASKKWVDSFMIDQKQN